MLFFKTNFNAIKTGLNNENVDVLGGWGCSKYVTCAGCKSQQMLCIEFKVIIIIFWVKLSKTVVFNMSPNC